MAMQTSPLKRTGKFIYQAMVVAKASPQGWAKETTLLRLTQADGVDVLISATGDARQVFAGLDKWRIYDIEIAGACVKSTRIGFRYNIRHALEVHVQFPCKIQLSKDSWPLKFKYQFTAWDALNQLQDNCLIDLHGRVLERPRLDPTAPIKKATMVLGNDDYSQSIDLLGEAADVELRLGDVVAFGGLRMKEYRKDRSLETTHLTLIEVNPTRSDIIVDVPVIAVDGPKRKAMRMTDGVVMTADEVNKLTETFRADMTQERIQETREVFLVGKFKIFDDSLFEGDPPLVGEGEKERICWPTLLTDATGDLQVNVWDKPAMAIFNATASKFRQRWEEAVEDEDMREPMLNDLNKHLDQEYKIFCSVKARARGFVFQHATLEVKVHVNMAEIV